MRFSSWRVSLGLAAILVGLFGGAIGYTCFGLSRSGMLIWFAIPFLNLMTLTWPSAQA